MNPLLVLFLLAQPTQRPAHPMEEVWEGGSEKLLDSSEALVPSVWGKPLRCLRRPFETVHMEPSCITHLLRRGSTQAGSAGQDRNRSHTPSDSISNPDVVTDTQWLNPSAPDFCHLENAPCFQSCGAMGLGMFGSLPPPPPPRAMRLSPSCRRQSPDPAALRALSWSLRHARAAGTGTWGRKGGKPAQEMWYQAGQSFSKPLSWVLSPRTFPERPSRVTDPQSHFSRKRVASVCQLDSC